MKILTALEVELTRGEMAQEYETENLEAWGYLVRANSLIFFGRVTKENNAKARELLQQALKLDPDYPSALVVLGRTHLMAARMGWSESPAKSVKQALKLGQKAVALDDKSASVHWEQGRLLSPLQRWSNHQEAEGFKSENDQLLRTIDTVSRHVVPILYLASSSMVTRLGGSRVDVYLYTHFSI